MSFSAHICEVVEGTAGQLATNRCSKPCTQNMLEAACAWAARNELSKGISIARRYQASKTKEKKWFVLKPHL